LNNAYPDFLWLKPQQKGGTSWHNTGKYSQMPLPFMPPDVKDKRNEFELWNQTTGRDVTGKDCKWK